MTKEQKQEPVEFFEDEKPGEVYIRPNLDMKLSDRHKAECREIVSEIKKFGINQRQLLHLIDLLSMEVENNDVMRALRQVTREAREQSGDSGPTGLIIPGR
jgi:hypothetical protein